MSPVTSPVTMLIVTAALAVGAQLAHADTSDNSPRQAVVHFTDLDLARTAGVSVLHSRLKKAAGQVCEPLYGKAVRRAHMYKQCVADAMSRAVAQVGEPNLTAYYNAKMRGRGAVVLETAARQ